MLESPAARRHPYNFPMPRARAPHRIPMPKAGHQALTHRGPIMADILYLLLGLGGFAVCFGFVQLCNRL